MKQYFIEITDGVDNFNLWLLDNGFYYCVGTMFYNDPLRGTDWIVTSQSDSISHTTQDGKIVEVEKSLKRIDNIIAKMILKDTKPLEIMLLLATYQSAINGYKN